MDLSLTVAGRDIVLFKQQMTDSVQNFSLKSHFFEQVPLSLTKVSHAHHLRKCDIVRFRSSFTVDTSDFIIRMGCILL